MPSRFTVGLLASKSRRLSAWLATTLHSLDYDGDHFITAYDIEQTTIALTRNELAPDEIQDVCDRVIEEANNDDDGVISLAEFQAVISRSPDFLRFVCSHSHSAAHTPCHCHAALSMSASETASVNLGLRASFARGARL